MNNHTLYHSAWADQRLATVLQIIVNWFTNGCDTVMYYVRNLILLFKLVLGDIENLRRRYDMRKVSRSTIFPVWCYSELIQKTNNFICLHTSPLLI